MSMAVLRLSHGVPAKRGGRVRVPSFNGTARDGRILRACIIDGRYFLRVALDDGDRLYVNPIVVQYLDSP